MPKKRLIFAALVGIVCVSSIVFIVYKEAIFEFTAKRFGICPENSILCNMRMIEEVVPCKQYPEIEIGSSGEGILVGNDYEENPFLLMKYRIEYMPVKTIGDMQGGVVNYGEPLINMSQEAPNGFYYKYPLKNVLESRPYSKRIWTKMNEYYPNEQLKELIEAHKNAMYP